MKMTTTVTADDVINHVVDLAHGDNTMRSMVESTIDLIGPIQGQNDPRWKLIDTTWRKLTESLVGPHPERQHEWGYWVMDNIEHEHRRGRITDAEMRVTIAICHAVHHLSGAVGVLDCIGDDE